MVAKSVVKYSTFYKTLTTDFTTQDAFDPATDSFWLLRLRINDHICFSRWPTTLFFIVY